VSEHIKERAVERERAVSEHVKERAVERERAVLEHVIPLPPLSTHTQTQTYTALDHFF
jgi:hypothetical protein